MQNDSEASLPQAADVVEPDHNPTAPHLIDTDDFSGPSGGLHMVCSMDPVVERWLERCTYDDANGHGGSAGQDRDRGGGPNDGALPLGNGPTGLLEQTLVSLYQSVVDELLPSEQLTLKVAMEGRRPQLWMPASEGEKMMQQIMTRCWAQEPTDRPDTKQLADDVNQALKAIEAEAAAGGASPGMHSF